MIKIGSNEFDYKNKTGEFKYVKIKDLVNNIRNNTISKISAKKCLNTLIEIRNAEKTKYKKRIPKQKELLSLFNNLSHMILTDKTLESESQENENEKVEIRKEENEKVESRKEEKKMKLNIKMKIVMIIMNMKMKMKIIIMNMKINMKIKQ